MIKPGQGLLFGLKARLLLASLFMALAASSLSVPQENRLGPPPEIGSRRPREGEIVRRRVTEYSIKARVPVLGDIGYVGTFAIEEEVRRNGSSLNRFFRVFGSSKPELARKGKDYSGELEVVRTFAPEREVQAEWAAEQSGRAMSSSLGYFKKNGVIESESILFFPDHAVSRREDGSEKRVEGSFGCLISAIEHFLECEVKEGDTFESKFVLGGHPFIFKCEVGPATRLQPRGARVFPIDLTTYDGVERDGRGMPKVVKKKGGIRLWLSKEEPFKDTYLRLMIQYKWYLRLHMEIVKRA